MWPFRRKLHLKYPSVEAWLAGESIEVPIWTISDPIERDRRITEYGELRRHLFAQHVATLTAEEQRRLSSRTHPSQSHEFADRASPFCELLQIHLAGDGVLADVSVGVYHGDRIVLCADLLDDPKRRSTVLPCWFHAFEVKYSLPNQAV